MTRTRYNNVSLNISGTLAYTLPSNISLTIYQELFLKHEEPGLYIRDLLVTHEEPWFIHKESQTLAVSYT